MSEELTEVGSIWGDILFVLIFVLGGLAVLYWGISIYSELFDAMEQQPPVINFKRGAFHLIGGGVVLIAGAASIIPFLVTHRLKITPGKNVKLFSNISMIVALVCLIPTILGPTVAYYVVGDYLEARQYHECPRKVSGPIYMRTVVFTRGVPCEE